MIPFAPDTITIYHKAGGAWARSTVNACSWRQKAVNTVSTTNGALLQTVETTVRIPADVATIPVPGDIIILGSVDDSAPAGDAAATRLLEAYRPTGAMRVQSVADNARAGTPIPHYAAKGE